MAKRKAPVIEWVGPPDFDAQIPYRRIYRPKPGAPVQGVILSEKLLGVWVHWLNGHDQPHMVNEEECPGCLAGHRTIRWKGYLECMQFNTGVCFLAELTELAVESCPELRTEGTPLRGRSLRIDRVGKMANSRCTASVGTLRHELPLPPAADVRRILEALWFGRGRKEHQNQEEKKEDEVAL